jgi:hypothetical protein
MALISIPTQTSVDEQDQDGNIRISQPWGTFFSSATTLLTALTQSGTTANRPTKFLWTGRTYFDISLNKPVWYTVGGWRDATGAIV